MIRYIVESRIADNVDPVDTPTASSRNSVDNYPPNKRVFIACLLYLHRCQYRFQDDLFRIDEQTCGLLSVHVVLQEEKRKNVCALLTYFRRVLMFVVPKKNS